MTTVRFRTIILKVRNRTVFCLAEIFCKIKGTVCHRCALYFTDIKKIGNTFGNHIVKGDGIVEPQQNSPDL